MEPFRQHKASYYCELFDHSFSAACVISRHSPLLSVVVFRRHLHTTSMFHPSLFRASLTGQIAQPIRKNVLRERKGFQTVLVLQNILQYTYLCMENKTQIHEHIQIEPVVSASRTNGKSFNLIYVGRRKLRAN